MKQEDKKLLQCLCETLPHGLFVAVKETDDGSTMVPLYDENGDLDDTNEPNIHSLVSCNCYGECDIDDYSTVTINEIIPYLRPMSSMTEEERKEYESLANHCIVTSIGFIHLEAAPLIDWLNEHRFDYRGLIEKGLALPATEGMYK